MDSVPRPVPHEGRAPRLRRRRRRVGTGEAVGDEAFHRLLGRTAEATTVGSFALVAVVASLGQVVDLGVRTPLVASLCWSFLAGCAGLGLVHLSGTTRGASRQLTGPAAVAVLVVLFAALGALVAVTGGADGPFWVLVLPPVLLVSVLLPRSGAVAVGVLASTSLAVATSAGLSGDTAATATWLLVVLGVPPLAAWFVASATGVLEDATARLRADREALDAATEPLVTRLTAVAAGDLDTAVPDCAGGPDASARLGGSLGLMVDGLRRLTGGVREGVDALEASGARLREAAGEQGTSSSEQRRAVGDAVARVQDLAVTADAIAEAADVVAAVAERALASAEDGRDAVAGAMGSLERIGERVEATAQQAASLGVRSGEIDRILDVLEDLVDSTDLLALNAAIEADRAGEHGRGFAVVAEAVRELAERAAASTHRITDLVEEMRAEVAATVQETAAGASAVAASRERGRGAVAVLERVVGSVEESAGAAQEIGVATRQQRTATRQLVAAVGEVDEVSRRFAEVAGDAQTAAERLDALGASLLEAGQRVHA